MFQLGKSVAPSLYNDTKAQVCVRRMFYKRQPMRRMGISWILRDTPYEKAKN